MVRLLRGWLLVHNMPQASQFPAGQPSPVTLNGLVNVVNNLTNDNIAPGAGIEMSKTATATTQGKSAVYVDNAGTPSLTNNQVIYRGWNFTTNSGTGTNSKTVTLPNSGFDDANYEVFVTYLGEKNGTPSNRHDVDAFKSLAIASVDSSLPTSSTQFKASFNANGGGNFTQIVFNWMAIGTKAT